MGRALDNAMLNIGMKDVAASKATSILHPASTNYLIQRVSRSSVSAWKTLSAKNTMLLSEMEVLVVLPPASSTAWPPSTTPPGAMG